MIKSRLGKVTTVLFDYGNTLVVDPFHSILDLQSESFVQIFEARNCHVSRSRLIKVWGQANDETSFPHISHFYQEKAIVEDVLRKLQLPANRILTRELLSVYRKGFDRVLKHDTRYKRLRRVLISLRSTGLRLGVLSNERRDYLRIGLDRASVLDLFEFVLSSEEIGYEKPDVRFFSEALSILGLSSCSTLYVGDDPSKDIAPSAEAGLRNVLLIMPKTDCTKWRNYETQVTRSPDAVIRNLSKLIRLFPQDESSRKLQ